MRRTADWKSPQHVKVVNLTPETIVLVGGYKVKSRQSEIQVPIERVRTTIDKTDNLDEFECILHGDIFYIWDVSFLEVRGTVTRLNFPIPEDIIARIESEKNESKVEVEVDKVPEDNMNTEDDKPKVIKTKNELKKANGSKK